MSAITMIRDPVQASALPMSEAALKHEIVQRECEIVDNKSQVFPKSPAELKSEEVAPETHPFEHHISLWTWATSYFTLILFLFFARLREGYRQFFPTGHEIVRPGYAPIVKDFDHYWNRRFYRRIRDCFMRPIDSRPSCVIGLMERVSNDYNNTFTYTGRIVPAVNMGSYNYLGFAEDTQSITHDVLDSVDDYGLASCSAPQELGQSAVVSRLEKEFSEFLGKEDAIVCGMGFGTNFRGLPALFGKETLVLSDNLNHSSLVNGVRSSGAKVKVFQHDHFDQVEQLLRDGVVLGQDPTGEYRPYRRIVVIIEGIYSMEGEIVNLKKFVELKKKYGALLFMDEAHSIGAIGRTGRGVCEHCGVDPKDVDILMGTFTKSFGSIGGYIAADKKLIHYLRQHSSIALHCDLLAPPCAQQVLSVLHVLLGKDGTDLGQKRIRQLKENSTFFRRGLMDLGFVVLGDDSSPVVPVMCYNLGKLSALSRMCLERGVAIVVVGYPATPLLEGRIRFCVSACHTREDLQHTIDVMRELKDYVYMDYNRGK
ncbi:putative serine palmitoyltransferase [Leptomonas seymouri]|uniref:serine C-palmitoyltransferase n=1 Tax=Leptomonas seymouri TaxID=5684 RepID=A0A0N0P413_LEPSE|nr:putative serine palmitoyltransferase [Leptomonas seymouri]|eukprot:KPI84287.1 putative serine palmitoyltransferase [Leptomonas seymouri]